MKYLNTKPGSIEEVVANMSKHQNESGYQDMFKKELEKAGKGIGAMTPAEKKAFFNKIDDKYKAKNEDIKEAVDNPYAVGMAVAKKMKNDEPPLKKSTITKAHDIAKSIAKDDKKEEVKEGYGEQVIKAAKMYMKDSSCTYEMAAEKYGCSAEQVKMCAKEMMKSEEAKYPHKMYSKDGKEVEAKTPADHEKYAKMGYTHKNETHSFMTKDMNKSKKDAKGEKEIVDPAPKMKFKEAYKKAKKEAMNTVGDATADQANQRVGEGPKENDPDIKKPKSKADTGSKATPIDTSPEVEYKN